MSWQTRKLGEICEVVGGGTPSTSVAQYWNGDITWITPKDLGKLSGNEILDSDKKITREGLERSSAKLLPKGTVVFSSRAPIGYVAIAGVPLATNQGCRSFICDESKVHNRLLLHFLLTQTELLNNLGGGSTFREVSGSKLKQVEIPLPPIEEQKKIVAKLENLLGKLEEARKFRAQARKDADALLSAELHRVFEKGEKRGWKQVKLGEICSILDNLRKPITKRDRRSGSIPYYGATGIQDYVADFIFNEDLVLVGEDGARWGAGENSAYKISGKSWVNNHAHVLRPYRDIVLDDWLVYFLNVSDLSEYITGTTVKKLNQAKLRAIEVPIPSLNEQKKIVVRLDSLSQKVEEVKVLQKATDHEFDVLEQAILSKAFSQGFIDENEAAEEPIPMPAVKIFPVQQAIGVTFQRGFERGEMPVAKVLYMAQELYDVPLAIPFTPQNFGPYDTSVKKALTAGLSKSNRFFKKRGLVYTLGDGSGKLLKYTNSRVVRQMNYALNQLLPKIEVADSASIERLASVCMVVQETQSNEVYVIVEEMQRWKGDKFTNDQVEKSLQFILEQGWDKKLIRSAKLRG